MKRNALCLAALALAIGLVAAGCGSDDSSDDSTESSTSTGTEVAVSLSKADFIQQADAICQASNDTIEAGGSALPEGASIEEQEAYINDTVVPEIQGQLDDIRALGAPDGDEDAVNAFIDSAEATNDQVAADASLLTDGTSDPYAEANQLASAYGLTVCGQ